MGERQEVRSKKSLIQWARWIQKFYLQLLTPGCSLYWLSRF